MARDPRFSKGDAKTMTSMRHAAALSALCAMLLPSQLWAQSAPSARSTQALAMLDGMWSGPALVIAPDGQRYEAKAAGATLSGVAEQARGYQPSPEQPLARWSDPFRFDYEASSTEILFSDRLDPSIDRAGCSPFTIQRRCTSG